MLRGGVHERAAAEQFFHVPQTAEAAAFLSGDLVV